MSYKKLEKESELIYLDHKNIGEFVKKQNDEIKKESSEPKRTRSTQDQSVSEVPELVKGIN